MNTDVFSIEGVSCAKVLLKGREISIRTIKRAVVTPVLSQGKKEEIRIGDKITAQNNPLPLLKGYDIKLYDCVVTPELLLVCAGGDLSEGNFSPPFGAGVISPEFTLVLYSRERDQEGEVMGKVVLEFPGCHGLPCSFDIKNGIFVSPEIEVRGRPPKGAYPLKWSRIQDREE